MLRTPRSAAQTRILHAALELIAERGVSGTSLQMIADAVGSRKPLSTTSSGPKRPS